jgi:hypothetical protein
METFWSNRIKHPVISVVGNGVSRKGLALNSLPGYTIGCNAVHRDYTCPMYVAADRRIVEEIKRNDKNSNSIIFTRKDWASDYNVNAVPDLWYQGDAKADNQFHWNTGPMALHVASEIATEEINIIGFDLWPNNDKFNNIYADSPNYNNSIASAISPHLWIYQIKKVFENYTDINFIQWQKEDWQLPQEWLSIKNLTIKYFSV